MASSISGSLSSVPNGRIIDFEIAELRKLPFQDSLYLLVRGTKSAAHFDVKLAPRVYHNRPDYWDIEVTAIIASKSGGDTATEETALRFEHSVPLSGITGNLGITVVGASHTKRIEISNDPV